MNNCPSSFKPLLYRRYVDDCFLLFRSSDHVPLFLDYLNQQHANITFTTEMERDGKLPFLYIDISRSKGKFATSVYRKPTFTGLFTNFNSFIPLTYKQNLVSCLIHSIFNLCASYENFHTQLEAVRKLFNSNGFPSHMFDRIVRRILDHTFDPRLPVLTASKKIIYFCLGSHSQGHILYRYALKSINSATPLFLIFTLDSSFVLPDESLPFFPSRIKFPNTWDPVWYTYSSVDAVPRRMWVKPRAIYTLGCLNIWVSLQSRKNIQPTQLCLVFCPI